MTGSTTLDIVIGLVFIYLLYSLLATIVQEIIATWIGLRARLLRQAISRMLNDGLDESVLFSRLGTLRSIFSSGRKVQGFAGEFYLHPLIKYLGEDTWHSKPSYLSARNFSKVVIDLLRGKDFQFGDNLGNAINAGLAAEQTRINPQTLSYLRGLWIDSQGDVDRFRDSLEKWFDDTMLRVTGWYKRYTQVFLFFIGLLIAISFNVDTLTVADKLNKDPQLRAQIIEQAQAFQKVYPEYQEALEANSANSSDIREQIKQGKALVASANKLLNEDINKTNTTLGLGWEFKKGSSVWQKAGHVITTPKAGNWLGFFLTALAISLGAPFWFDLLNKLMKLRGSTSQQRALNNPGTAHATEPYVSPDQRVG